MIFGFFFLVFLALGLLSFVLWIMALVECATKESDQGNTKLVWILVIVFSHFIGALLYYLVRRPRRIAELGR